MWILMLDSCLSLCLSLFSVSAWRSSSQKVDKHNSCNTTITNNNINNNN